MAGKSRLGGRGRYYAGYLSRYAKKNNLIIGLGALFLAGVLAGALMPRSANAETMDTLGRIVNGFVEKRAESSFTGIFSSASFSSMFFVGVLFFCGFSAIAQPVEIAAPVFRGLGFGFSVSALYISHGASAAGYVALFMLPGMLISTVALLFCARESLKLSGSFFGGIKGGGEPYPIRLYVARYLVAAVVCLFSAFLEASVYTIFANFAFLG